VQLIAPTLPGGPVRRELLSQATVSISILLDGDLTLEAFWDPGEFTKTPVMPIQFVHLHKVFE
jgi:hypothetical protein